MKLGLAIQSCVQYRDRRESIRNTWLQDAGGLQSYFFVGKHYTNDTVALHCGDTYEDCAHKQLEMIRFMQDYDYVFFCDDDTYVVVERLLKSGFEQHDYVGCPCRIENDVLMAHGGAGFWMSHKAMMAALQGEPVETTFSDRLVGHLMHQAGIQLHGDFRYNLGKYHGDAGFCNILPNRTNSYITTHFATSHVNEMVYSHFKEGISLPKNMYPMDFQNHRAVFMEEEDGTWAYSKYGVKRTGFGLAQDAEECFVKSCSASIP